ncbi:sensor histidine kinase [Veillonella criceti]|uniref:histidine kinase n=1 Tax=Veillonella criceti TaxID=103891 RepID=A0A380NP15_9FIRM|nr:HAMP domain-containing sensor histidine kinase [Veillonella criceti]SUP44215.1 Sensor kinase CusS [Veillonella criceti]
MYSKWKNRNSNLQGISQWFHWLRSLFVRNENGTCINPFNRLPITLKITGWYSIFLLLMLLMLSVFIMQFTQLWEDSEMRSTLQSRVINTADNLTRFRPFQEGVFTVLYMDNGVAIKGAIPDGFPPESMLSPHHITEITVKNSTFYYYDAPVADPAFHGWVRGVLPATTASRAANIMLWSLLLGGVIFLVIGTSGGYWIIKRGLRPIRNMTKTAATIGQKRDLSQRIEQLVDSHDEIAALSQTFNSMLDSLENSSLREKQFSSDVSHELRTPIAVIQAESDFGRAYIDNIDEAKESFEHIFQQSRFMTAMVTQLLDIARLDNMDNIKKDPLDLSHMMQEVVDSYRRICKEKSITLQATLEPNLSITGNLPFLKRAVGNLVDNAIKFTKDTVTIALDKTDEAIRITVSDNGEGINEEDLAKIWDRLYQVDQARTKKADQGLGLGLYFVQNIIKLHQAKAYAVSEPHVSTSFILEFPTTTVEASGKDLP